MIEESQEFLFLVIFAEFIFTLLLILLIEMRKKTERKALIIADFLALYGLMMLLTAIASFYINILEPLRDAVELVIGISIFSLIVGSSIYSASYVSYYKGQGVMKGISYFFLLFSLVLLTTALSIYVIELLGFTNLLLLRPIILTSLAVISLLIGVVLYLMAKSREMINMTEILNEMEINELRVDSKIDLGRIKIRIPEGSFFSITESEYGAKKLFVFSPEEEINYLIDADNFEIKGSSTSLLLIAGGNIIKEFISVPYERVHHLILRDYGLSMDAIRKELEALENIIQNIEEKKVISLPMIKIEKTSYYKRIKMPFMEIVKGPGKVKISTPFMEVENQSTKLALISLKDTIRGFVRIIIRDDSVTYRSKDLEAMISREKRVVKSGRKEIVYSQNAKILRFRDIEIMVRKDLARISRGKRRVVALPVEGKVYVIDEIIGKKDELDDQRLAVRIVKKLEDIIDKSLKSILEYREHSLLDEDKWFDSFFS